MARTTSELLYATVAYADIFEYPLTKEEALLWFIGKPVRQITDAHMSRIKETDGMYMLRGRNALLLQRKQKALASRKKWKRAVWIGKLLRIVPTIRLVGITGGLAMNNVTKDDDIDVFIIAQKGTIWGTRLASTVLLDIFGLRRRPHEKRVTDKICLNMFMDMQGMRIDIARRDLFSAHEVLQMVPIWERGSAYVQFLKKNAWVKTFLPNAWEKIMAHIGTKNSKLSPVVSIFAWLSRSAEPLFMWMQMKYMQRRRTTENVSSHILAFHPRDARVWVKEAFKERLARERLPLDKIFFGR